MTGGRAMTYGVLRILVRMSEILKLLRDCCQSCHFSWGANVT